MFCLILSCVLTIMQKVFNYLNAILKFQKIYKKSTKYAKIWKAFKKDTQIWLKVSEKLPKKFAKSKKSSPKWFFSADAKISSACL